MCLSVLCLCSEPLGFVRNLKVTDPTTSTLNVRWDPAEGNVREYIVIWVPAAGGDQDVVRLSWEKLDGRTFSFKMTVQSLLKALNFIYQENLTDVMDHYLFF